MYKHPKKGEGTPKKNMMRHLPNTQNSEREDLEGTEKKNSWTIVTVTAGASTNTKNVGNTIWTKFGKNQKKIEKIKKKNSICIILTASATFNAEPSYKFHSNAQPQNPSVGYPQQQLVSPGRVFQFGAETHAANYSFNINPISDFSPPDMPFSNNLGCNLRRNVELWTING